MAVLLLASRINRYVRVSKFRRGAHKVAHCASKQSSTREIKKSEQRPAPGSAIYPIKRGNPALFSSPQVLSSPVAPLCVLLSFVCAVFVLVLLFSGALLDAIIIY